jgi:uncharacterized phage protein (TIGR01671 family)
MREIEFRAWDEETSKIHYQANKPRSKENIDDELIIQFDCTGYSARTNNKFIGDKYVMQYTGLKDTDGKKIFEGDILNIGRKLSGEVVYIDSNIDDTGDKISCAFHIKLSHNIIPFDSYIKETCLVIGNIYENKKLLEE